MQSLDQCERDVQAAGVVATSRQLAWLYERKRAIEAELLTDRPPKGRKNWEAALDVINNAIERRSENAPSGEPFE